MNRFRFQHAVAAGTWDHFHRGHQFFLGEAFRLSQKVTVAITAATLLQDKSFSASLQTISRRRQTLINYLKSQGYYRRSVIITIHDAVGPAAVDQSLQALFVTANTAGGGRLVNRLRLHRGFQALQLVKVKLQPAQDGQPLSSSRIRRGEISRQGLVYLRPFHNTSSFILPDSLRSVLTQPFGKLIQGTGQTAAAGIAAAFKLLQPSLVVYVGDIVTRLALHYSLPASLYLVDFRVERKKRFSSLVQLGFNRQQPFTTVVNPAGSITGDLARQISRVIAARPHSRPGVIKVAGEEDLAVIPAILALPLGAVIIYGQPRRGVVICSVTETQKARGFKLLSQFSSQP